MMTQLESHAITDNSGRLGFLHQHWGCCLVAVQGPLASNDMLTWHFNYTSNLAYLKPPDTSSQAGFET